MRIDVKSDGAATIIIIEFAVTADLLKLPNVIDDITDALHEKVRDVLDDVMDPAARWAREYGNRAEVRRQVNCPWPVSQDETRD